MAIHTCTPLNADRPRDQQVAGASGERSAQTNFSPFFAFSSSRAGGSKRSP
jgi:hypothetical protein